MPSRKKNEFQEMDLSELLLSADADKLVKEWRGAHPDKGAQQPPSHSRSRKGIKR